MVLTLDIGIPSINRGAPFVHDIHSLFMDPISYYWNSLLYMISMSTPIPRLVIDGRRGLDPSFKQVEEIAQIVKDKQSTISSPI